MSEEDYKAGLRGGDRTSATNQEDYDRGESVRKARDAVQGGSGPKTPKTEVSGVGLTMILTAPILAIMYPVAGLVAILGTALAYLPLHFLPSTFNILKFLALLVAFLWVLIRALKVEHRVSRLKSYRIFRQVFRIAILGSGPVAMLFTKNAANTNAQAFNEQTGAAIFVGFVGIALMLWIFPKLDRLFFPVMDDKAIAEAKKFEGMSEQEVWNVKNLQWRNRKRFVFVWLALSVALVAIFRQGVPAIVIFGGSWVACFALRRTFLIRH